jgi:hypothetical protein
MPEVEKSENKPLLGIYPAWALGAAVVLFAMWMFQLL